jgi:hypothetical protein
MVVALSLKMASVCSPPAPRKTGLRPCTLVNFIEVRRNALLRNHAAQVKL